MPAAPALSVVTAVRDGAAGIAACLASVAAQGPEVEHVVVDGASRDGTVDILRSATGGRMTWTSAPDQGISDAFNRGIARAAGEAILILGADDRLLPDAGHAIIAALQAHPGTAFVFGHCLHREGDGRTWLNGGDGRYWLRMRPYMPDVNHATMAIRRSAYERVGGYDLGLRYAMDYDWLLRAEACGMRGVLIDALLAERTMGGVSDRHWVRSYAEARDLAIRHGTPRALAWLDWQARVAKGLVRRGLVAVGLTGLEHRIRRWRQRRVLGR
jgi:GT2 family glycosyltransferase